MNSPTIFEKRRKKVGVHLDLVTGVEEQFNLDTVVAIPHSIRFNGLGNVVFVYEDEDVE